MRLTLGHRLFVSLGAGTAVLALAVSLLIDRTVVAQVQANEDENLRRTQAVFEALQEERWAQLLEQCRLVGDIPYFKAAAAVLDPTLPAAEQPQAAATVLDVAHRILERVKVDLLVLTDEAGRPVITAGPAAGENLEDISRLAARALSGPHAAGTLQIGDGLVHVTSVPMEIGGRYLGALCLGMSLDSRLAASLEDMTGSGVALVGRDRILAASPSVPAGISGPLLASVPAGDDAGRVAASLLEVGGGRYRSLWVPLESGGTGLMPGAFVVLRSEDRAFAFLSRVRRGLVLIAGAAVGVGLLFSFVFSRRLAVPIQRLVAHTERVARGDLHARVETGTGDEFGALGDAFNRMGEGLAESRRRLEESNRQLEQRTHDLERSNRDLRISKEQTEAVNRALEETHAQLIQAGKMAAFGELGASIAHELRQPLTAIRGYAQLVELKLGPERTDAVRHLRTIVGAVDHMTEVVQGLRDFSRKASFEFTDVDLAEVFRRTTVLLEAQLRSRGIKLTVDLEATARPVRGDANQLQQVFTNLLGNARDAVEAQRGHIHVETRMIADGTYVMASVTDNGCGIPPDVLPKIFASFFTTKPEGEGTGLGLAITQSIVKDHGGRIDVSSRPGEGTVFRVFLPTAEAKPCWEMIDCVRDCRPEIAGKEECAVFQEGRGHRCWDALRQLAEQNPEVSRPDCEACPVHMAKNRFTFPETRAA